MDYVYDRSLVDGVWNIESHVLAKAVPAALPGKPFSDSLSGTSVAISFTSALSIAEKALLDSMVASLIASFDVLEVLKARKIGNIDARTREIIDQGFQFEGNNYSLSEAAQRNLLGIAQMHKEGVLPLPLSMPNIDDTFFATLTVANIDAFVSAGRNGYASAAMSGTPLKNQVTAATTVAELDAIVDNR